MTRRIILVDIGAGLTLRGVLPSVALFATYNATLKASGGQAPYAYSIVAGVAELAAAGIYLDAATGIISGTAGVAGVLAFTVRVTDLGGAHVDRLYSINVIAEPLTLSGDAPNGQVGVPYSFNYAVAGGVPPYVFDIASGVLPAGLAINAATGALTGTPTNAGSVFWTVRVTDTEGATTIADGAVISYETLALAGDYAAATVGTAYSSDLTISGGDGTYSNPRVTVGALPAGLALSVVSGKLRLSGTPTTAATSNFTVAVDSGDGQTATSAQSVVATIPIVLSTWDGAKKPPLITLTSSTVAKCTSTVSYNSGGGITPKSAGKWAFVCTLGSNNDGYMGVGASVGAGNPWMAGFKPGDANTSHGEAIGMSTYDGKLAWTSQTLSASSIGVTTGGVAAGTAITVLMDLDSTPQTLKFYIGNTLKASLSLNAALRGIAWVPLYSLLYNNQTATINAGQTTIAIPTPEAANGYNAYWG